MERYMQTNKIIMSMLGLWPYQSKFTSKTIRCLFFLCVIPLHIAVLINLYEVRNDFEQMLISIPIAVIAILFYVNYIFLTNKSSKILQLLVWISNDFKSLQSHEVESEILHKSAKEGKLATDTFTGVSVIFYSLVTLTPPILDIIIPLNETRQKIYLIEVQYVIFDRNEYYYVAYLHTLYVGTMVIFTLIATDILLYSLIQHACGMFQVLWFQLHKIKYIEKTDDDAIYRDAVSCIKFYDKLLLYTDEIDSCFSFFLLISVVITVIMMSFQGAMIVIRIDKLESVIRNGTFYVALVCHLLYISIPGQKLLDHSRYMIFCLYDMQWYEMPFRIKKLLQLIMIRSVKESRVSIGQFSTLCIETYSTIMKLIFQYLSVLTSSYD